MGSCITFLIDHHLILEINQHIAAYSSLKMQFKSNLSLSLKNLRCISCLVFGLICHFGLLKDVNNSLSLSLTHTHTRIRKVIKSICSSTKDQLKERRIWELTTHFFQTQEKAHACAKLWRNLKGELCSELW